jgi:hypothetical protein
MPAGTTPTSSDVDPVETHLRMSIDRELARPIRPIHSSFSLAGSGSEPSCRRPGVHRDPLAHWRVLHRGHADGK